jgi:chorismate synthase
MNSFGQNFRLSIFGESHGPAIGVVLDGVPAGISLKISDFTADLARRQGGTIPGTTPRREADIPEIVSGLFNGHTTGAPLTILFRNENTRSADYDSLVSHPRPSHADLVAAQKFHNHNDPRGGGHFSGRLTLALVAAGVVAKQILRPHGITVAASIAEIGGSTNPAEFESIISAAMLAGDSVGGIIECQASGVPPGLGEPFFNSVESVAAHLLFSIPAVKGVEFGSGFYSARMHGSQNNDPITSPSGYTSSNNAGGIVGGISNSNNIYLRVAIKPTPSISTPQNTLNLSSQKIEPLTIHGRHDACITLRANVVVEASLAIILTDFLLVTLGNAKVT